MVRRSARANKGQHSLLEREGRKRKIDVVSDEEGETRCLCGDDTDDGGFMIQCEMCGKWQHGQCMGFEDPEEVKETYACDVCRPDLYTDVPDKESKELEKKKKPAVVKKTKKIVTPKPAKRKTPPSDESEDNSDFSASDDENPKKKTKIEPIRSPSPKLASPTQSKRRKPAPINTARRASQVSPQQRRSSTSATPSTPVTHLPQTPLATKFADHPDQKRVPAARIFAKIFEPIEPTQSEALGLAIEHALYTAFATSEHGYGAEYKARFRSISFNLKDAKNSNLRQRVLTGELTPDQLVRLTSEEMANQELREQAEKIREEGVANSVLKVQTGPRIRRTHKGEEIVEDEVTGITPTVSNATAPFARVEDTSPPPKTEEGRPASPRPSESGTFSPPQRKMSVDSPKESPKFDISDVWDHLASPRSPRSPPGDSVESAEPIDLDGLLDDLPSNQIEDADIDRIINDNATNSPPYSPSAAFEDAPSTEYPPIWTGTLAMASVAHFSAQARFVGGPHTVTDLPWSAILPQNLVVDGRIPIDTTVKYLLAQLSSSTKVVVAIRIEATDDSNKPMETRMYKYFHDRQRYGVLQLESNIAKDAYIIPLAPEEEIPQQIQLMDSHEIPQIRTEPYLLAVLVIQKAIPVEVSPPTTIFSPSNVLPPATSPANPDTTTTYSPADSASIESLGLSPADLAALQAVLIAHPEILTNPQILTNPAILQSLIQQHLGQQRW